MNRLLYFCIAAIVSGFLHSCFTGVEATKKITDGDVKRAIQEIEREKTGKSLEVYVDSLPSWKEGKGFWVVDDKAHLIFSPSQDYNLDSLLLLGKKLLYTGYGTRRLMDNSEVVDIYLSDGVHKLSYPTGKPYCDLCKSSLSIPFLVDDDMLRYYAGQLEGRTVYVKTSIWFDAEGNRISDTRKFIPVVITGVKPGNEIYPLKVEFTAGDNDEHAMIWMTTDNSTISGRDFDACFSFVDPRKQHSKITNEIWERIKNGKVAEGMTKEECRLSMGAPKNVRQLPDQDGLREYWYYDGGRYLFFVDGLLKEFR